MNKLLILNAILWSAILLATSYLFKDSENYKYFLGIWTVGFTLQNGYTYTILKKEKRTKDKENPER